MKSIVPWKQKGPNEVPTEWDDPWIDKSRQNPLRRFLQPFSKSLSSQMPFVEVIEDTNNVIVRAETPGMTEKEIKLTWLDGVLRISGEKKIENDKKNKNRYYSERSYGYFSREIPLSDSVDWKGAKARYHNGVLSVKLPKTKTGRKVVEIKVT